MKGTVDVHDKLVRTVSLTYFIQGVTTGPNDTYTYSSFNNLSQIVAPSSSKTVSLNLCIDGKTHITIPGVTCGVAG